LFFGRLTWLVLCLGVSLVTATLAGEPPNLLNYIYIDASEGNSSGGHVALQFNGTVYHFQHVDPGLIQLFRENTGDFEYRYRYLENRNLEVSRIGVTDDTFQLLRDYFEQRYQTQKRQFELLHALDQEKRLLQMIARSDRDRKAIPDQEGLPLPGAGLFFSQNELAEAWHQHIPSSKDLILSQLRREVQQRYGADFLARHIRAVDQTLQELTPPDRDPEKFDLSSRNLVPADYTFYHRYRDLVLKRLALQTLEEARPLKQGVHLRPEAPAFRLGPKATEAMCLFQQKLKEGILDLVDSRRPDPGYALMVQMARLIVVTRSCESGHLAFLDLFMDGAQVFPLQELPQRPGFWQQLALEKELELRKAIHHLETGEPLTETAYSLLETKANRYFELRSGIETGRPIRLFGLYSLPDQTLSFSNPAPSRLPTSTLIQASESSERLRKVYLASLKNFYRYHLLSKNCVTEIFHTLEQAIQQKPTQHPGQKNGNAIREESIRRLGGYIDPGLPGFIPFVSSKKVREHYRIIATQRLESYRHERLAAMPEKRKGLLGYLKESSTLTSTFYHPNGNDSFFLFFTDDALFPRPLYGATNTLAALLQSITGLALLPFDHGHMLHQGALGLMSSIVELAFFNIRKGSYVYTPPGKPGLSGPVQ